jgi:hypothetical protein
MPKLDTQERLRRAADLVAGSQDRPCDATLLLEAWEYLKGLHNDDLPQELQPAFSFLQHEISRANNEDLSAREVVFLAEKIRKLELMWLDTSHRSSDQSLDAPV